MSNGFSTPIWGPPLWRILHTLGAQVSLNYNNTTSNMDGLTSSAVINTDNGAMRAVAKHVNKIVTWLQTFCTTLPCYFCRDSYAEFLTIMENTHGRLVNVVTNGQLAKWVYDIHELINDKLDKQHALKTLVPVIEQMRSSNVLPLESLTQPEIEAALFTTNAYRGRRITFECVQKRYIITPISFSAQDVWDVLAIFSLNYPEHPDESSNSIKKAHDFIIFVSLFPVILHTCGMFELANYVKSVPLTDRDLMSTNTVFKWVIKLQLPNISESAILQIYKQYSLAQAGSCLHGACI